MSAITEPFSSIVERQRRRLEAATLLSRIAGEFPDLIAEIVAGWEEPGGNDEGREPAAEQRSGSKRKPRPWAPSGYDLLETLLAGSGPLRAEEAAERLGYSRNYIAVAHLSDPRFKRSSSGLLMLANPSPISPETPSSADGASDG